MSLKASVHSSLLSFFLFRLPIHLIDSVVQYAVPCAYRLSTYIRVCLSVLTSVFASFHICLDLYELDSTWVLCPHSFIFLPPVRQSLNVFALFFSLLCAPVHIFVCSKENVCVSCILCF